jgi:hypothetical protein
MLCILQSSVGTPDRYKAAGRTPRGAPEAQPRRRACLSLPSPGTEPVHGKMRHLVKPGSSVAAPPHPRPTKQRPFEDDVSTESAPKPPAGKSLCSCSCPRIGPPKGGRDLGLSTWRYTVGSARHALSVQISWAGGCGGQGTGTRAGRRAAGFQRSLAGPIPHLSLSRPSRSAALLSPIRSCRSARLTRKLQPQPDPQQRAATQPRANPRQSPPAPCLGVLAVRGHLRAQGLFQVGQSIALCDNSTHPPGPPNSASPRLPTHPAPSHKESGGHL